AQSPETARGMGGGREVSGRRKEGVEFPAEATITKLIQYGNPTFTIFLRDVSERKHAEEAIRQQIAQTQQRTAQLSAINEVARALSKQLDLEQVLQTSYEQVKRIMSADAFWMGHYDAHTGQVEYLFVWDEGKRFPPHVGVPEAYTKRVLETGEPI